jgi:hypothetical protein
MTSYIREHESLRWLGVVGLGMVMIVVLLFGRVVMRC